MGNTSILFEIEKKKTMQDQADSHQQLYPTEHRISGCPRPPSYSVQHSNLPRVKRYNLALMASILIGQHLIKRKVE